MSSTLLCSSFFLSCLSFISHTAAFSFGVSPPTQCDQFTISWTGGIPPYDIIITPAFDSPRKFSVSSFPNNGNFTIQQLPLSAGQQFIVSMSDATGFATGGVSDLYTVGKSINEAFCSTDVPSLSFKFSLPSSLQQCGPYNISWDPGAVMPITITGLIPLGKPVQLISGTEDNFFLWDHVNIPSGTRIIFFLIDKEGRFGGSSHVLEVGKSNDNSCIDAQSPQSAAIENSSSSNLGASSSTSVPQITVTVVPSKGTNSAAIGGAVAGGLVACLILGTLATFFFRTYFSHKRATPLYSRNHPFNSISDMPTDNYYQSHSGNPFPRSPPDSGPSTAHWMAFSSLKDLNFGSEYAVEPFTPSVYEHHPQAVGSVGIFQNIPSSPTCPVQGSSQPSKSPMDYPPSRPARFVLHTDAEDEDIELPPQYNDRLACQ